jgi:hypothetical protein
MEAHLAAPRRLYLMVFAGLLLFALSLSTLMLPYSRIIEENDGKDLTCLHVPFTRARAAAIIDSYNADARAAARALHLPGDMLFPLGYALLYSGLLGLIARRQEGWWRRAGKVAIFFPVAAMVLDWTENFFILRMLAVAGAEGSAAIPAWMPLFGGIAGALKYLLLAGLTPLYGLGAIVHSLVTRRPALTAGLALTYLVAALLLLFNLVQVVTGVVPCLAPAL